MQAENFTEELLTIGSTEVRVTTYKIGEQYHCHVSNKDPGATIARASSTSREAAIEEALGKAKRRILNQASGH